MSILSFFKKPSVKLVTGLLIFAGTNFLVAKGTAKYVRELDAMDHVPDKKEKIALAAKCYGPAVGTAIAAAGVIVSSNMDLISGNKNLLNGFNNINYRYKAQKDAIMNTFGVKDILKLEEKTVEEVKHHPYSGNIEVMIEGYDERIETTMEELMDAELQFEKEFAAEQQVGIGYLQELLGMHVDENAKGFNVEYLYDKYGGGFTKEDREKSNFIIIDWDLVLEDNNQYYILHFPQEPIAGWDIKSA